MKIAYLLCELKSRDLDSRLLIAAHLLKRGVSVVVGQQWAILANIPIGPKGAFLFKTVNTIQAPKMKDAKAAGHAVVAMDEENLALASDYMTLNGTDPVAIANSDLYLFQDDRHKSIIEAAYPGVRGEVVGSPRAELLMSYSTIYEAEAAQIRAAGKYVLVNTNLTLSNSVWGDRAAAIQIALKGGAVEIETAHGKEYVQDWIDNEKANMKATVAVVQWLVGHLKGHRIVVRPHPAENVAEWRAMAGVEVATGTNPAPWILGADLVIHTNSTTGLEAHLLKKPCLNISPMPNSHMAVSFVMPEVNHTVTTAEAAIQAIDSFINRSQGVLATARSMPALHLGASERIADCLLRITPESARLKNWGRPPRTDVQRSKFTIDAAEFQDCTAAVFSAIGLTKTTAMPLDDSVFLIEP